jgi:hypothetical protein
MIRRFVLVMFVAGLIVLVQLGCGGGDNVPRIAGDAASTLHPKVMIPNGGGGVAPKPQ